MTDKHNGSGRMDSEYDSNRLTEILAQYIDRLNSGEMLHREGVLREEPELGEEILEQLQFYQTVGAGGCDGRTPRYPRRLYLVHGLACEALGDIPKAARSYCEALELRSDLHEAREGLARLLEQYPGVRSLPEVVRYTKGSELPH